MNEKPMALQDSPPFPERFFGLSPNLLCVIGMDGSLRHLNPSWTKVFGYTNEELKSRPLIEWVHPDDRASTEAAAKDLSLDRELLSFENRVLCKDGSYRWLLWNAASLREQQMIYGFAVDITRRKTAEQNLAASQEELQRLAGYLQKVREQERTAIARDLHDELGQQLSTLQIDITCLEGALAPGQEKIVAGLREMEKQLDASIRTVQRIATGLRPSLLDDLGLAAAIEWQAKDFIKHTHIPCRISIHPETIAVDPDLATTLFRILQETLTNVARHARASEVWIEFSQNLEGTELIVRDNGRGIQSVELHSPQSLGLIGMRERLRPWEGKLEISGDPGGTIVRVLIPSAAKARS
jgi:PAS domain S-box-containing protein